MVKGRRDGALGGGGTSLRSPVMGFQERRGIRPLLDVVDEAFAEADRPEHFTDHTHCEECAEHDETLRSFDRDSIGLEQLGNPGWDPMCFVNPEGFLYYLPAMVRLALSSRGQEGYLDQFLFHLTYEGEKSRFFGHFSGPQRRAVLEVLRWIGENMTGLVREWSLEGEMDEALALWNGLAEDA